MEVNGRLTRVLSSSFEDYMAITNYKIRFGRLKGEIEGICNPKKRVIIIDRNKMRGNDHLTETIVHEMIHAYIAKLQPYGYDYPLFLYLHGLLSKKLGAKKFKRVFTAFTHVHQVQDACGNELAHSPLFWLKSVELDLRLRRPLGTVAAYGKEELMKQFIDSVKKGAGDE
jgi:hypothetical protein